MIITVGLMGKILQEIIPVRTVCIQKPDTNVRPTKKIAWEDPKPTKNDWQGRHLNVIVKVSSLSYPTPSTTSGHCNSGLRLYRTFFA
jgi:hypothetical protein